MNAKQAMVILKAGVVGLHYANIHNFTKYEKNLQKESGNKKIKRSLKLD